MDRPEPSAPTGALRRLLNPRHIAVVGGQEAAEVLRQCRLMGFSGRLWPVHPTRETMAGLPCYRSVADLPEPPDAVFVSVPRAATVEVVADLAGRGAGGAVCYASGFAEAGGAGVDWQRRLVEAAGGMALIGPNCYGVLNYLDGAALWPDSHGGHRVDRGVAIVTQSGNIGLNLTMQRRGLPVAYLVSGGNLAVTAMHEIVEALLDDPRVTAIGLHIEGLADVAAFARVAVTAQQRRIPIVALKSGSSAAGARMTMSHTSSLAGPDALYDALFARVGIARVRDPATLLEALALCHLHGALPGARIASASCSGGDASLVADLAAHRGLVLPELPEPTRRRLAEILGDRVTVGNPLDYHTYIWGDEAAQTECFSAFLTAGFDLHLLVLDLPREDRCEVKDWTTTLEAFIAAQRATGAPAALVSSMPEGLPEEVAHRLLAEGITPMHGLAECIEAIAASAAIGAARPQAPIAGPSAAADPAAAGPSAARGAGPWLLDEWEAKQALAGSGVPVPAGRLVDSPAAGPASDVADAAVAAAAELGYPVVVKALSGLAHKSEAGAVAVDLADAAAVRAAVTRMAAHSRRLLVEPMIRGTLAELLVGVRHDPTFGYALTLGAGGVLVELLDDVATLLLPVSPGEIRAALGGLRIWPLLAGYRGRPAADVDAIVRAAAALAAFAEGSGGRVVELEVNPLLVLPAGGGAVAVDTLLTEWW